MSVFTGTSVKGEQFIGSISPVSNGILRFLFPGFPSVPLRRRGYIYVLAVNNNAPNQSYIIDERLLVQPGLAVNYGTSILTTGISMRVEVVWNEAGVNWQCTMT